MIDIGEGFAIIPIEEYERLKDSELFLDCLEAGGVDNWCWYGEACDEYERIKKEETVNGS